MRVVGLDLAGIQKNGTGYCLLLESGGKKTVSTRILHSDAEIIDALKCDSPLDLVAVDAPLKYDGNRRGCDDILNGYGALPVSLRGMETLAKRGKAFADELTVSGFKFIEVHSVSSAKILGIHHKGDFPMQKAMMGLDLEGDLNSRILLRDELDAVAAAVTAYLHLIGHTKNVGDCRGEIVIPAV
ncbi:MAG: hypothetical protein V1875_00535 [Candidatus Altiarchaeota archaeon]